MKSDYKITINFTDLELLCLGTWKENHYFNVVAIDISNVNDKDVYLNHGFSEYQQKFDRSYEEKESYEEKGSYDEKNDIYDEENDFNFNSFRKSYLQAPIYCFVSLLCI